MSRRPVMNDSRARMGADTRVRRGVSTWLVAGLFATGMVLLGATLVMGFMRGDAGQDLVPFSRDLLWLFSLALFVPFGALVAWKHPRNPVGWLILAIGLAEVLSKFTYEYAAGAIVTDPGSLPGGGLASLLSVTVWVPEIALFPLMLLLFPDGRLPSRRWAVVGFAPLLMILLTGVLAVALWPHRGARLLSDSEMFEFERVEGVANVVFATYPVVMVCLVLSLVALIFRFRRARGDERQQLKWIALVAGMAATLLLVNDLVLPALSVESAFTTFLSETLGSPGLFAVVATIAIMKYRLYDIDLIINRTLVYGGLTALLATAYLGIVVALQNAIPGADDSDLTIAGSTLAVAALFRPLRSRVQGFIDRRFYRRKFDAQRTLESFSSRLREDVDLDHLSADLLTVVRETMQPVHASLWIRTMESGS
jgi:hypothetical protein